MNIKFNIHQNSKTDKDGKVECSQNNENSKLTEFSVPNLDFLYTTYQMFPHIIMNCCKPINNLINKYTIGEKQLGTYENISGKPGIIPATGNDIYNYIARYGMANFQIQIVVNLNGILNHNTLLKAIRLSIAAEPVFGCRFVENQPPYWKTREDIDKISFFTFEMTNNLDEAIQKFLESPLDMDRDPMIKMKLIRSGQQDTLCIKINHTCCDGTGAKEYVQLLSDIYSRIDQNGGVYVPKPKVRTRKDQDRLFSSLGIENPEAAGDPLQDIPKTLWAFPWQMSKPSNTRVAVCRLPHGHVDVLSRYAKSKGATINDLIVTALYRALFEMSQPFNGIPMDISMTVDLRRYLPDQKTEAIRNFSGGFNTKMSRIANETFEGTLSRVIPMMDKIKNSRPGLLSAIGLERVEKSDFHQTNSLYRAVSQFLIQFSSCVPQCAPVLSNLGILYKDLIKFGENVVNDAYIVPPAICAPGLLLCIGTYNGVITMSVSYYQSQAREEQIQRFLNLVAKELVEGCRN